MLRPRAGSIVTELKYIQGTLPFKSDVFISNINTAQVTALAG